MFELGNILDLGGALSIRLTGRMQDQISISDPDVVMLHGPGHAEGQLAVSRFGWRRCARSAILLRNVHLYPEHIQWHIRTHSAPWLTLVHDLMIVYPDAKKTRAIYFDNEGHVIHYGAHFSPDGKKLTLLSNPSASTPGYRLSYIQSDANKVKIQFEIAPPGKPGEFHMYLQASARRKLL